MITDRVILNCIQEVKSIADIGMMVTDGSGKAVAKTDGFTEPEKEDLDAFLSGSDEEKQIGTRIFIRIPDEEENAFILVSDPDETGYTIARLAASQIKNLILAFREKGDRNSFYQNLLLDNMISADIHNRARKLHIDDIRKRCVYVMEPMSNRDINLMEMVRELFFTEAGDHITTVDEDHVVIIKALDDSYKEEDLEETARMLVDMAGSEAMTDVRVAYGMVASELKGVSRSYKEAKMALDVGKIFYPLQKTIRYSSLGIGRLIYQLPVNLCQMFVKEIFKDTPPESIDDETLLTVNRFFENNLNVSETSRQLFIHRNTLIYRIEKLQKALGLDIRVFDDALTLKIALMVVNYMKYEKSL